MMVFDNIERMKLLAIMAAIIHSGLGPDNHADLDYDERIQWAVNVVHDLLAKLESEK